MPRHLFFILFLSIHLCVYAFLIRDYCLLEPRHADISTSVRRIDLDSFSFFLFSLVNITSKNVDIQITLF